LLIRHKHPGTYRIHASPSKEKLTQLRTYLKQLGLGLNGGDKPTASDYADLMKKIKGRLDAPILQTMLLRSMQQAVYSPDNIGHFGLSYEAYAHFTSPIRRYPDLLTHRAIKAILLGKKYEPKGIDLSSLNSTISNAARKQQIVDKAEGKTKKDPTVWDALGVHCSANERRADEASRDVEAWLKCYYIRNKLGEEFTGTISGVTQFGIFVQLDALYIEARHELRGERTGKRYQLTDRVTVQVSRVDLDARKIDLCLVQPGGARLPSNPKSTKSGATSAAKAKPKAIAGASTYEEIAPPKHKVRRGAVEAKSSRSAKTSSSATKREKNVTARSKGNARAAAKTGPKKRS
jgi:ribonuclease R